MQRQRRSLSVLAASAAIAAAVVFVGDFFYLSDFTIWGEHQCDGVPGFKCAMARHLGKWWLLWDVVAAAVLTVAISSLADLGRRG